MSEKKVVPSTKRQGGKTTGKTTTVGSAEAGRDVLAAAQKATVPVSASSKLTDLLNRASQLPKPEAPSAKVEKVTTPSLKQEEEAGRQRQLVKQLTPHFEALKAAEAELADAKTTSTEGNGNIFVTEATRAQLEQIRQEKITELEKKAEESKNTLQPFFDEAPSLRKMLEMKFEASQKMAVAEQANQAMIQRVQKLAEDNFAGGVTPGRVSVFLEKAARMIGVLDRVPADETSGLDRNSKKVLLHRFSQDVAYGGFMADFRKEAVAKAKASGTTEGYVKDEVWFKADSKDPRPGMIAIGIARAKEGEIYETNKARKTASSSATTVK